jgi:hypothetical protein
MRSLSFLTKGKKLQLKLLPKISVFRGSVKACSRRGNRKAAAWDAGVIPIFIYAVLRPGTVLLK